MKSTYPSRRICGLKWPVKQRSVLSGWTAYVDKRIFTSLMIGTYLPCKRSVQDKIQDGVCGLRVQESNEFKRWVLQARRVRRLRTGGGKCRTTIPRLQASMAGRMPSTITSSSIFNSRYPMLSQCSSRSTSCRYCVAHPMLLCRQFSKNSVQDLNTL